MDNNNLFDQDNQNGEQGQFQQQQPYQSQYQPQQPYQQQQPYQSQYQPQQPYQQQQPYQSQYQQQQPYQAGDSELEEPVSFADWMISMLIMLIPCVNIIMMFVWAFGSGTKKSKSNYFKASLVWMLISVVLSVVMLVAFGAIFASLMQGENYYSTIKAL